MAHYGYCMGFSMIAGSGSGKGREAWQAGLGGRGRPYMSCELFAVLSCPVLCGIRRSE